MKQLRSREKTAIFRLSENIKRKRRRGAPCLQTTAKLTGVRRRTVSNIRREARETGILSSPVRRVRTGRLKEIDDFDRSVIRARMDFFYRTKRVPTLSRLLQDLRTEIDYAGGREHLRMLLKEMGISWRRTSDNRQVLMEKEGVVQQRMAFYERRRLLKEDGYTFVYIDETWLDSSYCAHRCWQGPGVGDIKRPLNKGRRLIVVDAGSEDGFVPGARLVYKGTSSSGDYHSEMNGQLFEKWLREKLLPNIPPRSALVMDNASYHSVQAERCPTTSSRKLDIMDWLRKKDIRHDGNMLKKDLLLLVKSHRPPPTYVLDEFVRQQGHEILRLPPYHPDFNPIELIWSQLKSIVRSRNTTFRLDDMMELAHNAFAEITPERWRTACAHVDRVVDAAKKRDNFRERTVPPCVINLHDDTTSGDDSSATATASEGSTAETASEGSATETASEGSATETASEGSATETASEGSATETASEGSATETASEGSATETASEGSATETASEGSATETASEGSATETASEGSATETASEGSATETASEGSATETASEGSATETASEGSATETASEGSATETASEGSATETASEGSATETASEGSATETASEGSATETASECSATETASEGSATETASEGSATETASEGSATETASEGSATETASEGSATETASEGSATETVSEGSATETASEGSATETASEGSATETASEQEF